MIKPARGPDRFLSLLLDMMCTFTSSHIIKIHRRLSNIRTKSFAVESFYIYLTETGPCLVSQRLFAVTIIDVVILCLAILHLSCDGLKDREWESVG